MTAGGKQAFLIIKKVLRRKPACPLQQDICVVLPNRSMPMSVRDTVIVHWPGETVEDELVKNTDHSATGIAAEVGAIGRLGKFAVSVGFQTVGFKYHELSAGLGFFF